MEIGTGFSEQDCLLIFSESSVYPLEKVDFGDVPDGGTILRAEYIKFILSVPFTCPSRATFTLKIEPFAENLSISVIPFCHCFLY